MKFELKEVIAILIVIAGVAGAFAVTNWRVDHVDQRLTELKGEPLKLALLESDVRRLKCEIGNVKRLIKQQPELDC